MKERKKYMLFFIIVIAVNLVVNLYIFSRTRALFPAESGLWWAATILFWLLAFAYAFGRLAEHTGPGWLAGPLVKTGSWWLGAMVYLTLIFLLVDILRGVNSLLHFSGILHFNWLSSNGKTAVLLIYAITALILTAGYFSARYPVIRRTTVQLNKPVPADTRRVVLVSDIHLGVMISNGRLDRLVTLVNREKADLVLLAGDVFDEDLGTVIKNNMGDLLKNLKARHGVFAVLGNHEFYGNAAAAEEYLENHRITVLRDSMVVLPGGTILAGREDITAEQMGHGPRKSVEALLAGVDPGKPVFLMDHQPMKLSEAASSGVDLQVSGHTHNGQMWPFNYITGSLFEISRGPGKINDTHFYVSSGYGTWGPPIRTNSRSEIVVLEILGQ